MAVMMISHPDELLQLNRKQRGKMTMGKGGQAIRNVMIQEGISTIDQHQGATAERVVYSVGSQIVGGFYRSHPERGPQDSLNAPGMQFTPLEEVPQLYKVVAQLALLAAANE